MGCHKELGTSVTITSGSDGDDDDVPHQERVVEIDVVASIAAVLDPVTLSTSFGTPSQCKTKKMWSSSRATAWKEIIVTANR